MARFALSQCPPIIASVSLFALVVMLGPRPVAVPLEPEAMGPIPKCIVRGERHGELYLPDPSWSASQMPTLVPQGHWTMPILPPSDVIGANPALPGGAAPPNGGADVIGASPALPAGAAPPNGGADVIGASPALPGGAAPPNGGADVIDASPALPGGAAPPNGGADLIDVDTVVSGLKRLLATPHT